MVTQCRTPFLKMSRLLIPPEAKEQETTRSLIPLILCLVFCSSFLDSAQAEIILEDGRRRTTAGANAAVLSGGSEESFLELNYTFNTFDSSLTADALYVIPDFGLVSEAHSSARQDSVVTEAFGFWFDGSVSSSATAYDWQYAESSADTDLFVHFQVTTPVSYVMTGNIFVRGEVVPYNTSLARAFVWFVKSSPDNPLEMYSTEVIAGSREGIAWSALDGEAIAEGGVLEPGYYSIEVAASVVSRAYGGGGPLPASASINQLAIIFNPVPGPATLPLLLSAFAALPFLVRRKKR